MSCLNVIKFSSPLGNCKLKSIGITSQVSLVEILPPSFSSQMLILWIPFKYCLPHKRGNKAIFLWWFSPFFKILPSFLLVYLIRISLVNYLVIFDWINQLCLSKPLFTNPSQLWLQSKMVQNCSKENSRNKQFISLKLHAVLSSMIKSHSGLLHPAQDVNHPACFALSYHVTYQIVCPCSMMLVDHESLVKTYAGPKILLPELLFQYIAILFCFYYQLLLTSYCALFIN